MKALEGVTDDQLDHTWRALFHHAITDCLIAAQKKAEEKEKPPVASPKANALSALASLHLKVLDKTLSDLPEADYRKILQEGKLCTCQILGIHDEQFLSCINNPIRTADIAKIFIEEVGLGIREYHHMRKQTQITERRIDKYFKEPGEGGATMKTPTRDEVRSVIEQAVLIVQMNAPNANLDEKDRPFFHDCISELLKQKAQGASCSPSETYIILANTVLPAMGKSNIFGKYHFG